jgi:hypothetical protein
MIPLRCLCAEALKKRPLARKDSAIRANGVPGRTGVSKAGVSHRRMREEKKSSKVPRNRGRPLGRGVKKAEGATKGGNP